MIAYSEENNFFDIENEINIRDYFAAKAMQSLIALCYKDFDVAKDKKTLVQDAYEISDAMLKERIKNDS
jgi:hypothetical protein